MQDACGGGQGDGAVGHDARIMPAVLFGIVHQEHMVGKHRTEAQLIGRGQGAGMSILVTCDIHIDRLLIRLKFFQMLHVVADTLAALVEGGLFLIGQGQLNDLLNAVCANDAGNAGEQAALRRTRRTAPCWPA